MNREQPWQPRVHRDFLKADGVRAVWPGAEVRVRYFGEPGVEKNEVRG
ncbi:MAG: hypothetical protein JY451_15290 [Erythrobacter sp.]|nr:MAG: hypothetical protein JY451_15290 [Erythrobacter sp.]